jgi:hypothetical protein
LYCSSRAACLRRSLSRLPSMMPQAKPSKCPQPRLLDSREGK